MLKPSLQLRIGQQLTMTPQLQQAIRLLQLPSLDLQAHVRETLETNVMLEAEDELALDAPPDTVREREDVPVEEKYAELDGHATAGDQREEPEVEIADEAWGEQTSGPSDSPWSGDDDRSGDFSDQHGQTLQEQLIEQLELAKLSAIDVAIARVITDAITDDGYLKDDLQDIRLSLLPEIDATTADVERVLAAVQSLEPAGVGARNLGECIALQLRQLHADTPARDIAIRVALEHLDLVAGCQLVLLRRQLRCSEGDLEMALALVRSCHPRPGAAVNPAQAEYVIPDVFVRRTDHGWIVEINQASARSRHAADAIAGSAVADAQPRDPQRDLDQGGPLHRTAPDQLLRIGRGGDGAVDPEGRGRSRGNARIDHLPRDHRQIHAHAARRLRIPLFLLEPRRSGGRHRNVLYRHPRQDQEIDFPGES
jgi:RNA polymerase sigma-54 factor